MIICSTFLSDLRGISVPEDGVHGHTDHEQRARLVLGQQLHCLCPEGQSLGGTNSSLKRKARQTFLPGLTRSLPLDSCTGYGARCQQHSLSMRQRPIKEPTDSWGLTSVPGKPGRVLQLDDGLTSQKRFLAALGRKPPCLLSLCGFQHRAVGLRTDRGCLPV